ncbi:MAG TPA: hypothetical protein VGE41_13870, partial [Verrucomicrobiae bacterium]
MGLLPCSHASELRRYETGYESISKISFDLYKALDAKKRAHLTPVPLLAEKVVTPYLQATLYFDGTNSWQAVTISSGFINFITYLSHAKALEGSQSGLLDNYVTTLAQSRDSLPQLRPIANNESWSFDTMNHQVSHFNQIVGDMIAIEMAHHYLGHYQKYEAQLKSGTVPINSLLTPKEWHEAVMKGARNALDCGISVEGFCLMLQTLEKMKSRPDWA